MAAMRILLFALLVYHAHDGSHVRGPHTYRRHPNAATHTTANCKDGSISFSHTRKGACSHHGGVRSWR